MQLAGDLGGPGVKLVEPKRLRVQPSSYLGGTLCESLVNLSDSSYNL